MGHGDVKIRGESWKSRAMLKIPELAQSDTFRNPEVSPTALARNLKEYVAESRNHELEMAKALSKMGQTELPPPDTK
jgi:hypothetical protein